METIDSFEAEMFEKTFKILGEFETSEEVAAFFADQGIQAKMGNTVSCAISEYASKNMGL